MGARLPALKVNVRCTSTSEQHVLVQHGDNNAPTGPPKKHQSFISDNMLPSGKRRSFI